jgi:geranylgeranyl pyrophosphate synthase
MFFWSILYILENNTQSTTRLNKMSQNSTLADIRKVLKKKGGPALKKARKTILRNFKDDKYSSQALRYFSKVTLHNALPVFPALISISCEAVGGDAEKTTLFGEAIVLISAAADLHDDVIDQSLVKGSKQTVFGKFNAATAILAGDILLAQGFMQLTEAAESITKIDSKKIIKLVSEAILEICSAESLENQLRNKNDLKPEEYLEVIRLKAVVPELSMRIGAILGNASVEQTDSLGSFGRIYGMNSLIIEEFTDLLDIEEVRNRLENECPPLPMIYALQNEQIRTKLAPLLSSNLSKDSHKKILEIVLDSKEIEVLGYYLTNSAREEVKQLTKMLKGNIREELENLLLVPLKYIEI